jgi:leader peptidase (prepilin peptidase) / N-methyltransferase
VNNLSALGAAIGLAVGAAAAPGVTALVSRLSLTPATPSLSHQPSPVRRQAVAVTVAVCVLTGLRVGTTWPLAAFLALFVGLGVAGLCDLHWRLLPKRIVYPTWAAGLVGLTVAAAATGRWSALATAAISGAALFAIFAALHLAAPSSMAFGDVRLAGPVGTALGWWGASTVVVGVAAGFVTAAAVSVILLGLGRLDRRGSVPLGTYLGVGTALAVWAWH